MWNGSTAPRHPWWEPVSRGYNRHRMIGGWRTVSHIVELEEQRVFGWAVVDSDGRHGDPVVDPAKPLAT